MATTHDVNRRKFDLSKLSQEELDEVALKCEQGDPYIQEQLIIGNMPFVTHIANKYTGRGVPFDDLFQEGCYGLMVAVKNCKAQYSPFLSTYFWNYIEKYMKKALFTQNSFCPIIFKEDFYYDLQKYIRIFDTLSEEYNRAPTDQELSAALRFSAPKVKSLRTSAYMFLNYPNERIAASRPTTYPTSLNIASPEDIVMQTKYDLSSLNISLNPREREVFCRKFGFTETGEAESFSQISQDMGLSYETIRQTYNKVLDKIRLVIKRRNYNVNNISL